MFGGFGASSSAAGGFGGFGAASSSAAGGFGGFGAASSSAAGGFGGFGAASSSAAGGFGGFGAASSSAAAGGFGGFGASSSSAGGFGGFGAAAASGGGFGAASSSAAGGFGGFGASSSSAGGFGGFGAASSGGGFGGFGASSSAAGGFGGGFGGFGGAAASGGGFGAAAASGGGFGGFGGGFGQPQQNPDPFAQGLVAGQGEHEVYPKVYSLWRQYFEKSPQCFCMAFLYNLVPESAVASLWEANRQKYQSEQYNITEGQWDQAKRDNPDPSRLLPFPVRSIGELSARHALQMKMIDRYDQEKKQLLNNLQELKRAFNVQDPGSLDRKLRDVQIRIARIRSRLLDAIAKLERVRPARAALGRVKGALDDKLQYVEEKGAQYQQLLFELDVLLSVHHQGYQKAASHMQIPAETLRNMLTFLDYQQKGLEGLSMQVKFCGEDLDIITGKHPARAGTAVGVPGISRWH